MMMSTSVYKINVIFEAGNRFNGGLKEQIVECPNAESALEMLRVIHAAAQQTDKRMPPKATRMRKKVNDFLNKYAGEIGTMRMAREGRITVTRRDAA